MQLSRLPVNSEMSIPDISFHEGVITCTPSIEKGHTMYSMICSGLCLNGLTKEAKHMRTCYKGVLLLLAALMQCLDTWLAPKAGV